MRCGYGMHIEPDPHLFSPGWRAYTGVIGAEKALDAIKVAKSKGDVYKLNMTGNLLGDEGMAAFLRGLPLCESHEGRSDQGDKGWEVMNLGGCEVTDTALKEIIKYVQEDTGVRKLRLGRSPIQLKDNVHSLVRLLNTSALTQLVLSDCEHLHPPSILRFFDSFHAPHLDALDLSSCKLDPAAWSAIAQYLGSRRSRPLRFLKVNFSDLTLDNLRHLIAAIKRGNFSLEALHYTHHPDITRQYTHGMFDSAPKSAEMLAAEAEDQRLKEVLNRNRNLGRRVQRAACRCLPIAQVILNALPSPDLPRRTSPRRSQPHFPLFQLPPELVSLVIRHTSGDAAALSHVQFTRLCADARGEEGLQARMRTAEGLKGKSERSRHAWNVDDEEEALTEKEVWLKKGDWEKWETNTKAA